MTHTGKRADGSNGTNRLRPHPFWTKNRRKALYSRGWKALRQLVRMRSAVRICPAAPKMTAVSRFFDGLQRFFVIVSLWRFCRFAGTILYIFRCMPANWLRTIFPALLIKNADLLIRFSRPIFRMGPTPAMRPACWPIPASCGAVPSGPPNPMWRAPVPSVPPGDEPSVGRDWHRRRSQTSGH